MNHLQKMQIALKPRQFSNFVKDFSTLQSVTDDELICMDWEWLMSVTDRSARDILGGSFTWSRSGCGAKYWSDIYNLLP